MDDSELVGRARAGDGTAWDEVVAAHQEAVFRLAYLILGNADDARDVAQDAFVRAYRALDRFDASRPLRPWLLSIGANLSRNRRRAAGRYLAAISRLFAATPRPPPGGTHTESGVVKHGQAELLHAAVQRLSQIDREIIYLRYFLDLSEAETASALGIAPGTVKSRLHRALNRLRHVVERDFPELREGHEDEQPAIARPG